MPADPMQEPVERRDGAEPFFEVAFAPNLRLVSLIRVFTSQFYAEVLGDEDLISRLELATHELLENAVKFSVDGLTRVRVDCVGAGPGSTVTIRTWNRCRASDVSNLTELLSEISGASDPVAFYQVLMGRAAKRTTGSGLGLGRIRAEAGMILHAEENQGQLCMRVVSVSTERS